jgi:hypothetical protein
MKKNDFLIKYVIENNEKHIHEYKDFCTNNTERNFCKYYFLVIIDQGRLCIDKRFGQI